MNQEEVEKASRLYDEGAISGIEGVRVIDNPFLLCYPRKQA